MTDDIRPGVNDAIADNDSRDGVDRRGFLQCMAWAGTGLVWTAA